MIIQTKLTFDDVLLVPQKSDIDSRSDVDPTVDLNGVRLRVPFLSSPMDTVTEMPMISELGQQGGMGVMHRFTNRSERITTVNAFQKPDIPVGMALGLDDDLSLVRMTDADIYFLSVANGYMEQVNDFVGEFVSHYPYKNLCVGNVVTPERARELIFEGANGVKVGIGPGSACITREKTGCGYPQLSAIKEVADTVQSGYVIADGGVRKPGDAVKALAAGADAVMMGGIFAGTEESPGSTEIRGMASEDAAKENGKSFYTSEGVGHVNKDHGTVEKVIKDFEGGLRSGMSYCGAYTIDELHEKAKFVRVTDAGNREGQPRRL